MPLASLNKYDTYERFIRETLTQTCVVTGVITGESVKQPPMDALSVRESGNKKA